MSTEQIIFDMTPRQLRYEQELAGTSFALALPLGGWAFESLQNCDTEQFEGRTLYLCLDHVTAQFHFALDAQLAVYVRDGDWFQLYRSVFDLVALHKLAAAQFPAASQQRLSQKMLGQFASIADFEAAHPDLVRRCKAHRISGDTQNALYYRHNEVIEVGRFYNSSKFSLFAQHYFS